MAGPAPNPKNCQEIFLEVPLCFDRNVLFIHPIPSNKIFKKQILKGWNLINWWLLLLPANAGDASDSGSIPRSGKSLEVGNGNPLQYSLLGNSVDKGAWPRDCKELHMTEHARRYVYICDWWQNEEWPNSVAEKRPAWLQWWVDIVEQRKTKTTYEGLYLITKQLQTVRLSK